MSYNRTTTINPATGGDTVKTATLKLDTDLTGAFGHLNTIIATAASTYAPIAKGVTNGDTHDHSGGDGGTIAYSSLSGTPTALPPPDGDKGDIVVSGLGSVFTIDSNVVTPAKMSRTGTAGQVLVSGGADADPYYLNQSSLSVGSATNATNATNAANVPWTGVTGRPTSLSSFSNDPGFITSYALPGAATESAAGVVELATAAEVQAGTDTVRAVTPAGLRSGLNAMGSAPIYACRAWVNFNGTGTVAIRASGNVSSITDNGTGDYTVNFTTAMPDTNYAANTAIGSATTSANRGFSGYFSPTTTSVRVNFANTANSGVDLDSLTVTIFR